MLECSSNLQTQTYSWLTEPVCKVKEYRVIPGCWFKS